MSNSREGKLMPCYKETTEHGDVWIMCGDLGPPCTHCPACSDYLCDYPVGHGKTCDAHLCKKHGAEVAPNIHYCPGHLEEWEKFKSSGGVRRELENVVPFKDAALSLPDVTPEIDPRAP